tara:strand:+ start:96 stop:497 length:402 start_codon:yes stop_codon:yes gene_type:complete
MNLAHIGFLYSSIDEGIKIWRNQNVKILKKKTKDDRLKVYCCLLKVNNLIIEIISPLRSNKVLRSKLKINKKNKPFGFDHLCFYSKNIDRDLKNWEAKYRSKVVIKKTFSKMFRKNVAFIVLKTGLLVELLEI